MLQRHIRSCRYVGALVTTLASVMLLMPGGARATPPNVVLITLDTTRADRMGFLGCNLGLTPNLDTLAKQSVIFARAYAHVPLTTASHATILTGTYPQYNGINDFGKALVPELPYLPDLLHAAGYKTAAFVGSLVLDPIGGTAPGFDRGFDTYNAGFHSRRRGEDRYQTQERRAGDVVARALDWLVKHPGGPFLLWVHLYDAHDPYDPPEPYATKYAKTPYDGEIAYTDAVVGKLLNTLRSKGLYEGALIAVMADHGEAFGEHGERTHGIFLYDETIHIPLVLKLPAHRAAGERITTRVGLVDVAPTALQAAGVPIPKSMQGESLLPLIRQGSTESARSEGGAQAPAVALPDRPAYAETDYPRRAFGWSSLRSLREGKYLFIEAPQPELYDQVNDPEASHNLYKDSPAVRDTLAAKTNDFRGKTSRASNMSSGAGLNPQQAEQLSALGYVANDAGPSKSPSKEQEGIDPKGKIEVANQLHDALLDVEEERYEEAVPLLQRVLADQPEMAIAQMHLGTAFTRMKRYREALPALQKAVELQPDSGMGHYELGLALFETGDWQGAAPQFEFAVTRAPRWADAHFSLAAVYARIDRIPDAMSHLQKTLELNADHYRAHLLRGRILSLQGNASAALPDLLRAVQLEPKSFEAHHFLAEAYFQVGQGENAAREQVAAQRLRAAAP